MRGYKEASCQYCGLTDTVPSRVRGPFTCRKCYADRFMAALDRALGSTDRLQTALKRHSLGYRS